jgi:SAM-dependent MidA family methyltransferase
MSHHLNETALVNTYDWQAELKMKAQLAPVDFSEFMAMALYHPTNGYYTHFCQKIGRDFITAPMMSGLFGQTIAGVLDPLIKNSEEINNHQDDKDDQNFKTATKIFRILEIGAGNANLATQILEELIHTQENSVIEYLILEISPSLQSLQQNVLNKFRDQQITKLNSKKIQLHFKFYQSIDDLNQSSNIVHSKQISTLIANEWLDAIPVNLWRFLPQAKKWFARKVAYHPDRGWYWVDQDVENDAVPTEIQSINDDELQAHQIIYTTESHEISYQMLHQLFDIIQPQQILLFDYGHLAAQYYHPQRHQGTLLCYFEQQVHDDVFQNIGMQDITAHVNFSAVIDLLEAKGWQIESFLNQARFLMNHGILEKLSTLQKPLQDEGNIIDLAKLNQGVLTLLSEAEMGEGIKVLHLSKAKS